MNSPKAGKDLLDEIPVDSPIPKQGITELNRHLTICEKPSTPRLSELAIESLGERPAIKAFKLLKFKEDTSSQSQLEEPKTRTLSENYAAYVNNRSKYQRTVGLNSTKVSFFNSLEPGSSLFGSVYSNERQRKDTFSTGIRGTTESNEENEDEQWLLPTVKHCNSCNKNTSTTVKIEMPTLPLWKRICCVNDLVQLCTTEEEWHKYQVIVHRCSLCKSFVGRVDFHPI